MVTHLRMWKKKKTVTSSGTNADSCVCNFKGALNFPESSTEPFRNYYRLRLRTCNLSSKEGSICDERRVHKRGLSDRNKSGRGSFVRSSREGIGAVPAASAGSSVGAKGRLWQLRR